MRNLWSTIVTEAGLPFPVADQLAAIAILGSALDQVGVDHWVFGGWAVDLWVGRVTRVHGDIDVAAWRHDHDRIKAALGGNEWRHTPSPADVVGTRYRWRSAQVEFTFVECRDGGQVIVPLAQPVVWSTEPFGDHRRELLGVSSRVIPLELLRSGKSVPRDGAEGVKDRADLVALAVLDR